MDKLKHAIMEVNRCIDSLNHAVRLLEMEVKKESDRLQRALDPDGQVDQADERSASQERLYQRPRPLDYVAWGDTVTERESKREKARNGIPYELRDLL